MAGVEYGTGRQALLDAAIRVVAAQGLRGLTYRSVAAEAGVSHGSVRYHFGNWASLVEDTLAYTVQRSIDAAELESDQPGFAGFAAALAASVAEDPAAQAFQYELALEARRRPELVAPMKRVYDSYRSAVRNALAHNGIDDASLGDAVFAAMDGLVFSQTVFGDQEQTQRALAALRSLIGAYQNAPVETPPKSGRRAVKSVKKSVVR